MIASLRRKLQAELDRTERLLLTQPHVRWPVVIAFLATYVALSLLINLVVFRAPWLDPLSAATHGMIRPTLVANVGLLGICVGGILLGWGRLRAAQLLAPPRSVGRGLVATLAVWGTAQGLSLTILAARGIPIRWAPAWTSTAVASALGPLLAQLAGNALFEEIAFRGFLLPQLFHRIRSRRPALRLFLAVLASQTVFALIHIPNRISMGTPLTAYPLDLFRLLGLGALFAVLYLRTGNLMLAVGIHALFNAPTALVAGAPTSAVQLGLTGIVLAAAPWLRTRSPKSSGSAGIAPGRGRAPDPDANRHQKADRDRPEDTEAGDRSHQLAGGERDSSA